MKYKKIIKDSALDPARRFFAKARNRGRIALAWCPGTNWGDALSPLIVGLLSGKPVIHLDGLHHDRFLAIGSILGSANENAEVWGSGFIRENDVIVGPPRAVHSVRGPLSRNRLLELGIDCPEVFGDPALLLPRFFNPAVGKQYEVGIIPHYVDKEHPWVKRYSNDPKVLIIDVEGGIGDFVRSIKSCDVVLSSSLHGLICADAYRVPNQWIHLSDQVVGGAFKFRDHHLSLGIDNPTEARRTNDSTLSQISAVATLNKLGVNLKKLALACPFLHPSIRSEIENNHLQEDALPDSFRSLNLNGPRDISEFT